MKRAINENARTIYRLLYILQEDVEDLRINMHKYNIEALINNASVINSTLNNLTDTIVALETAVILEKVQSTRDKQPL